MTEDLSKQVDAIISERNRLSVELEAIKQDYAVAHAEVERLKLSNIHLKEDRDRSLRAAAELTAILDNICILAQNSTHMKQVRGYPTTVDVEDEIRELVRKEVSS